MIDVGANLGFFSFLAASAGMKTYSFEPATKTLEKLLLTSRINGWEGRVFPFQNIASDAFFKAKLHMAEKDLSVTTVTFTDEGDISSVIIDDLLSFGLLDPNDVLIIKIDTGTEYDAHVLNGIRKIIQEGKPPYINIEGILLKDDACSGKKFFHWMMNEMQYDAYDNHKPVSYNQLIEISMSGTLGIADLSFVQSGFPNYFD